MATLHGQKINESFKDLLQVSNSNTGIDATLRPVADGEGTESSLQLSTSNAIVSAFDTGTDDILKIKSGTNSNYEVKIGTFNADSFSGSLSSLPGSQFGGIIQGGNHGKLIIGIRDNDSNDGLDIVSGEGTSSGSFTDTGLYNRSIACFRASGKVGIGIVSPTNNLHVDHAASVWGGITVGEAGEAGEQFNINHYGGPGSGTIISQESTLPLRFYTDGVERMRIRGDGVGRVGIGNVSPGAKLEVKQDVTTGAIPVLELDQTDTDQPFINFEGSSGAASADSISSSTASAGSKVGAIQVEINGATKWIRVYDSAV